MKFRILSFFLLISIALSGVKGWAQVSFNPKGETPMVSPSIQPTPESTSTPDARNRIPRPIVLKASARVNDSEYLTIPRTPPQGPEGTSWTIGLDSHPASGAAMAQLQDPASLNQIGDWNKSEIKPKSYHWHPLNGTPYCHYHDGSGNQWYGWPEGSVFHWVLYRSGYFWWHDGYAERSLYFDRGYWWWQGHRKDQFQVYLEDGHYHVCGTDGMLGDDLLTTGTEEVATQPMEKDPTPTTKPGDDSGAPGGMSGGGTGSGLSH